MQIRIIQTRFEAVKCNLEPFERVSKRSNTNSNHSKKILSIQLQIWTFLKGFEPFDCKFEPFEKDLKHSNAKSTHSKRIQSILMQVRTIRKGF